MRRRCRRRWEEKKDDWLLQAELGKVTHIKRIDVGKGIIENAVRRRNSLEGGVES